MLTVVSGRFHPGLEQALVDRVRQLKKDPLTPVAVVAPSARLMEWLQIALAESGGAYLNLHFHTFSSLAERVVDAEAPLDKPIVSDPLFFDTLVKQIVRDDKPFEAFAELAVPEGFPPAVRSTLRDLLDADVNEDNVEAAIQEEFAGQAVDLGSLRSLLQLHRLYLRRINKLLVFPRSELLRQAIELAPRSRYLKSFSKSEIIYYGFYDLTGLQADFFQEVVKHHPSCFFFPYVRDHPAYAFAKRFRDNFVQPVMREEIQLENQPSPLGERDRGEGSKVQILNVSGVRDEAWFVANEIRRLHDQEGIAFSHIAVIARTKDRLGFLIQEALMDRHVPYRASSHPSLTMFPIAQEAVRFLVALKPAETATSWGKMSEHVEVLLKEKFFFGKEIPPELSDALLEGVYRQADFDSINNRVTWSEFVETLRDRWSRTDVKDEASSETGVSLLYAEAARGLPFKAIFLIGLEEKVFPRIVREDPFLRDDARLALNQTLGHKIGQKMTALEEERLLFELLVSAASERLYLLYQRSDDEGSVVGMSSFLRTFAEERGISLASQMVSVPRALLDKIKESDPFSLGVSDVVIGLLSAQKESQALQFSSALGRDAGALEHGLRLQRAIHSFKEPGAFDGLIGKMDTADIFKNGKISADALETYGQCGFQYFATRMLELESLQSDEFEEKLAANIRGKLVHKFVEAFFRRVTKDGTQAPPDAFPKKLFASVFEEIVMTAPPQDAKLPPVLWEATRESLRVALAAFLENEFSLLQTDKFVPTFFETEMGGELPPPLGRFQWIGKIDRMDVKNGSIQVVDYKTGNLFKLKTVSTLAEKGAKFQAPVYLLLARRFFERMGRELSDLSFRYKFIDHVGESLLMDHGEWAIHSETILAAIQSLVDAAHEGNFVMVPDWYCKYCDVVRACRRNHGISMYRAAKRAKKLP